jgi:hypothetical protein
MQGNPGFLEEKKEDQKYILNSKLRIIFFSFQLVAPIVHFSTIITPFIKKKPVILSFKIPRFTRFSKTLVQMESLQKNTYGFRRPGPC